MSTIEYIRKTVEAEPHITRQDLSKRVCQLASWRAPNGKLKEMSCRKALCELERRGVIGLPVKKGHYSFTESAAKLLDVQILEISGKLAQLGKITVEPIKSRNHHDSKVWRSILETYHYLGAKPLCGAQLRYLINSETCGPVGALAFTSGTWSLAARDKYIGWTEGQRRANLDKVVNNSRFLIVPSVKVANLASRALSLALKRLGEDWEGRYAVKPALVETFVDPGRFAGTCYKAANWEYIGDSSGRRDGIPKKIFLYPLYPGWRTILCHAPEPKLGEADRVEEPANWAEEEFCTARLYDPRLKRRLYTISQDFYRNFQGDIPQACSSSHKVIAAYRFFNHKEVSMDVIMTAHAEATIERIREHPVVLAPQGTTTLGYHGQPLAGDPGPKGGEQRGDPGPTVGEPWGDDPGLTIHNTAAFTVDGIPLGIIGAHCWARPPAEKGAGREEKGQPGQKRGTHNWLCSFRRAAEIQKLCPGTTLVSIGDWGPGIYDLFKEAAQDPGGPRLLVRLEKTPGGITGQEYLWDCLADPKSGAMLKVHIPHLGPGRARDAWAEMRHAPVRLLPPWDMPGGSPITAWAVYLYEKPEEGTPDPIEWMLLTTAPVENIHDARQRVEWYSGRWAVEVYQRALKASCRIGDRRLGNAKSLQACLGVDLVAAWRIYHLTMLRRETPGLPCTGSFHQVKWKAPCCYIGDKPTQTGDTTAINILCHSR